MDKFKFLPKNKLENLPKTSGVYCFKSNSELLYIGKAINIKNRVKNHFFQPSYRDKIFMDKVSKIGYLETGSEIEALILEANLIKKHQPKFNVVWRDDKNYFYVALRFAQGKQKIPYVCITHQPTKKSEARNPKSETNSKVSNFDIRISSFTRYVGPFVEGTALKKTLRFLRKAFPYYTTERHSKLKCTWCHLDLCPGPNPDLNNYKKDIKKLILILKGKRNKVLYSLKKEMQSLSKQNKFEEARKIRDRLYNLQQVVAHAHVLDSETKMVAFLSADKNATIISPRGRIECYDISNIQGKFATGSMVVFTNGKPNKKEYKKFRVKIENTPNDIAMLKEILQRRFSHPEWKYPEAILIDGGKAQLNIAIKTKPKTSNITIFSLAKGRQELFIENVAKPIPLKKLPQETQNLILQLDAEAHRFAITYHKNLRKRSLLQ